MVAGGKINLGRAFSKAAKAATRFANSDVGHAVGNLATVGLQSAAGGKLSFAKALKGVGKFAKSDAGQALGSLAMKGMMGAGARKLKAGTPEMRAHMEHLRSLRRGKGVGQMVGKTIGQTAKVGARKVRNFARSDVGQAVGKLGVAAARAAIGQGFVPMGMGASGGDVRSKKGYMLPRAYGHVLGDGVAGGYLARGGSAPRIPMPDAISGNFLHRDINNTVGTLGAGLLPLA